MSTKKKKKPPSITRAEARKLLTLGRRKTSSEEVDRFLEDVRHGIPVMPVTFFCKFLEEWAQLYGAPLAEELNPGEDNAERRAKADKFNYTFMQIRKSNFLWRRIYGGQPTRLKPCPVHKGRWSGCKLPDETECKGACMDGSNVTGWLRE